MRPSPPHPLISYWHALLALAVAAWAVAGLMLLRFKGDAGMPVAVVVAVAAFVFIWANGAYWWIMFRYPYIEVAAGQYASRDEWKGENHKVILVGYFALAVLASVACLNVALSG